MKKFFWPVLIGIMFFLPLRAYSQNGVGCVDLRLLMILHPSMANFDYVNGLFYRENLRSKTPEQIQAELKNSQESIKGAQALLKRKESELIKRRIDLMQKRDETISNLNGKARKPDEKSKLVTDYEAKYSQEFDTLERQFGEIQQSLRQTNELAFSPLYYNSAETEKRISQIRKELQDKITQVAAKNGIAVVIDDSYGSRSTKKGKENFAIPSQTETPDLISGNLFHNLTTWQVDEASKALLNSKDAAALKLTPAHVAGGMVEQRRLNLKQLLDYRSYLPENLAAFSPGRAFLIGGVDLTPLIAKEIFDQYRLPEMAKQNYLTIIKDYRSFETTSYQEPPKKMLPEGYFEKFIQESSEKSADEVAVKKHSGKKPSKEKPSEEKDSEEKVPPEKISPEKMSEEKNSEEETTEEKVSDEKASEEKTREDKPASGKTSLDKPPENKPSGEKTPEVKAPGEKPLESKAPLEKVSEEKPPSEDPPIGKPPVEKPSDAKPLVDGVQSE
ncbi:MAG: hypothetical protein HQM08_03790 [Candidatus Riflebacteria bacterium]|nr:hypothetical protein [Candidatus Riflebacteria bacterium]